MKEQDDELKDLFQRKNLEDAFAPDEANWEKMAAVLKNEKAGGKKRFLLMAVLVLVTAFLSVWLMMMSPESKKTAILVKPETANTLTSPTTFSSASQAAAGKTDAVKQKAMAPAENHNTHQVSPAGATDHLSLPSTAKTQQFEKNAAAIDVKMLKRNKKSKAVEVTGKKAPAQHDQTLESKGTVTPAADATVVNSKNSATINSGLFTEKIALAPTNEITQSPESNNQGGNLDVTKTLDEPATVTTTSALNSATDVMSDNLIPEILPQATVITATNASNATSVLTLPNDSTLKQKAKQRITLDLGMNYLVGWPAGTSKEGKGVSPLAGFTYYYEPNEKFAFSLGLQYTTVSNLGATTHTSTTTRLKLGAEKDVTVISAVKLHYLLVPVKISYGLSKNDLLSAGCTIAYLVDAESKIENYNTRLDYKSTPTTSKAMGYTAGFNQCDVQVALAYRRWLYKAFYINGEIYYGLTDIKKNTAYSAGVFDRNYGFRLSLGINLWKK